MKHLEKLAELATKLPDGKKEAAISLVERMGEVIEGFGDKPLEYRPELLKLVQGTTDRSKLPKAARAGSLVLGEEVLDTPARVIPIRTSTIRHYWNPDQDKAQMICSSPDGITGFKYGDCRSCEFSRFNEETEKSQCNKTLSVISILENLSSVFITNFAKSNYMSGIDWQSLMKKAGVAPHKRVYAMSSVTSSKSKNVELIKVEPTTENRVEGAELDFMTELANVISLDRKDSLAAFYDYVEKRKNSPAELEDSKDDVVLLEVNKIEEAAEPIDLATDVVEKPSKSQNYKL